MEKIKIKLNYIHHLLLMILLFMVSAHDLYARNYVYNGMDVIFDRPEGELKLFKVRNTLLSLSPLSDITYPKVDLEYTVPFVFYDDGNVYARNLLGLQECVYPVWMKGKVSDGCIVFDPCALYAFELTPFLFGYEGTPTPIPLPVVNYNISDDGIQYSNDDGTYIFFRENSNGNWVLEMPEGVGLYTTYGYNKGIVVDSEMTPCDASVPNPPAGYPVEDYQINFMSYLGTVLSLEGAKINNIIGNPGSSLRLKVVRTPDEIFIRGLSMVPGGDPEGWLRGEISGNKAIFRNGDIVGIGRNSKLMYFTPMEAVKRGTGQYECIPVGEDLIFDYDPQTGALKNPSSSFGFTEEPGQKWYQDIYDNLVGLNFGMLNQRYDFFDGAELFKVPDYVEHTPVAPEYEVKEQYINIYPSYLDTEGYMMDPSKLFIEVVRNGSPVILKYPDLDSCKVEENDLFPFESIYASNLTVTFFINDFSPYLHFPEIPYETGDRYTVNLLYIDSSENESGVNDKPLLPSPNTYNDENVYDLFGRRINTDNLRPGIYIINGKKTMITR